MRVAIVGGGFAGVYAIKTIQHSFCHAQILLFEPRDRFVFTPLLHEVAADVLHVPFVTHEYTKIFRRRFTHVVQRADSVDLKEKKVHAGGKEYAFDYVVIAPGSRTRFPKQHEHMLELKSIENAICIRRRVELNVLHAAETGKNDGLLDCVIVGGGPTGVELAGELIDFYKYRVAKEDLRNVRVSVTLLHSRERLLPGTDAKIQSVAHRHLKKKGITIVTHARVSEVKENSVIAEVEGKRRVFPSRCTIWTAGVTPSELSVKGVQRVSDRIPTEATLQVKEFPHAFALGDSSHVEERPLPDLAQVAVQQGTHAGRNIVRLHRKRKPRKFKYNNHGALFSLGQKYAVGRIKGVLVTGFPAWFVWRTVYLMKFVGVRSKLKMAAEYTIRLFGRLV